MISRVGVPQYDEAPIGFGTLFGRNITLTGGPAPGPRLHRAAAARRARRHASTPARSSTAPSSSRTSPTATRAMDAREALKVMYPDRTAVEHPATCGLPAPARKALPMQYRPLGRTGVQVSPLCLGAMMFGPWGNDDQRRLHPHHPPRARRRHQLRRHRRRLLRRRVRRDRRRGAAGTPRRRRPGHQVLHADGRRPEPPRRLPPLDHARGRELATPAGHRPHRPVPGAPAQPRHRRRGDPRRAHRPRPARARSATSVPRPTPARRSSRRSGPPATATWSGSSPSNRRTRSSCAASRTTCCPPPSGTAWAP